MLFLIVPVFAHLAAATPADPLVVLRLRLAQGGGEGYRLPLMILAAYRLS